MKSKNARVPPTTQNPVIIESQIIWNLRMSIIKSLLFRIV